MSPQDNSTFAKRRGTSRDTLLQGKKSAEGLLSLKAMPAQTNDAVLAAPEKKCPERLGFTSGKARNMVLERCHLTG
jgi:hypothetical protein